MNRIFADLKNEQQNCVFTVQIFSAFLRIAPSQFKSTNKIENHNNVTKIILYIFLLDWRWVVFFLATNTILMFFSWFMVKKTIKEYLELLINKKLNIQNIFKMRGIIIHWKQILFWNTNNKRKVAIYIKYFIKHTRCHQIQKHA